MSELSIGTRMSSLC